MELYLTNRIRSQTRLIVLLTAVLSLEIHLFMWPAQEDIIILRPFSSHMGQLLWLSIGLRILSISPHLSKSGETPLHLACKSGSIELVTLLLQYPVDIFCRNSVRYPFLLPLICDVGWRVSFSFCKWSACWEDRSVAYWEGSWCQWSRTIYTRSTTPKELVTHSAACWLHQWEHWLRCISS